MKTKTGYTKKYLLAKLTEAAEILGHSPSQKDLKRLSGMPSLGAYRGHFGCLGNARKKAGLPPAPHGPSHPSWVGCKHPKRKPWSGLLIDGSRPHKAGPINSNIRCLGTCKGHLKVRFEILRRDNFTCQYCGRTPNNGAKLCIDHIVPFSRGGKTTIENLITSCFECNIGKSDVLLDMHMLKKQGVVE